MSDIKRYKLSDSILERQAIRLLSIAVGVMSIITSVQLLITYFVTGYNTWLQSNIDVPVVVITLISLPFVFGGVLIVGKIIRNLTTILTGLFLIWVYNLCMALLNAVAYMFQGTPMVLHLTVGIFALILYVYYQQRDEVKQDKELVL